jgi:ubiquinone/menaquinone biosynthesis C-methylase UbiE
MTFAKPVLFIYLHAQGDAEDLPFPTDSFDRYVSAGSIEYWPEPQRGIREAYRVIKEGGVACCIGPVYPTHPVSRCGHVVPNAHMYAHARTHTHTHTHARTHTPAYHTHLHEHVRCKI